MRRSLVFLFVAALAALLLGAAPAQAEHRSHRRGRVVVSAPRVIVIAPGDSYSHRPYGWDRGRKVGWGDCDLPPGLAKKYGCRSSLIGRHRYFDRRVERRFDRRFRRDSGVVIHVPGRFFLDLR